MEGLQTGTEKQAEQDKNFKEAVAEMNAELEKMGIAVKMGEWKWPSQLREKVVI